MGEAGRQRVYIEGEIWRREKRRNGGHLGAREGGGLQGPATQLHSKPWIRNKESHEEGPAAKKCKTEKEESHISISSLAEGNVTKVGSVNPVENFRVLVRQKIVSFEEASLQLISHIEQFLDTNETLYFVKSMECIKAFREEAIQFSEEQRFNSFLEALREKVEIKQLNHFWEIVVQDGVTLITKDEGPGSSVTTEEATKFLAPKDKSKEDAAELEEGGDVDDLLDMI